MLVMRLSVWVLLRSFLVLAGLIASIPAGAVGLASGTGYGLTDGGISHHGAMNLTGNPAAPASIRWEYQAGSAGNYGTQFDSGWALGVGRFSGAVTFGQLDDVYNTADAAFADLGNELATVDLINATEESLLKLEQDGQVEINAYISALALEIASEGLGGVWTLTPGVNVGLGMSFVGHDVNFTSVFGNEHPCTELIYGADLTEAEGGDADSTNDGDDCVDQLVDDFANGNTDYLNDLMVGSDMVDFTLHDQLFQEEAYLTCEDCTWGFIDTTAFITIQPKYDFVNDFVNDVSIVVVDDVVHLVAGGVVAELGVEAIEPIAFEPGAEAAAGEVHGGRWRLGV